MRTMPRQQRSKHSNKRASVRRCTHCEKIGHNARTCPELQTKPEVLPVFVHTTNENLRPTKKSSRELVVNVGENSPRSPHVVSLKPDSKANPWDKVEAYHAEPAIDLARKKINLAELVRKANTIKNNTTQFTVEGEGLKRPTVDILREITKMGSEEPYEFSVTKIQKFSKRNKAKIEEKTAFQIPRTNTFGQGLRKRVRGIGEGFKFKKFVAATLAMCVIVTLPFPALGFYRRVEDNTAHIVAESTNAFLSLQSSTVAAFNQNLPQAQFDLSQALNSFGNAKTLLDKEYKALIYILDTLPLVGTKIKSRQDLLEAGHYVALGNAYLIKGFDEAAKAEDMNTIDRLSLIRTHIKGAIPQYTEALERLDTVDQFALPPEFQESFSEFRMLFHGLVSDMENMSEVISGVELMLGGEGFKRYLIAFQNQYEVRPTGGFIGSFAIVDVQNGKIQNIDIPGGGSYDLQGQLSVFEKPPLPLQLINTRWEFQDANWFPDFKATGEKLAWFYQKSRGTTVDGVIAINASVLERLLRIIGPIEDAEHSLLLDTSGAIEALHTEIEAYDNSDGKNQPKAILASVLEEVIARVQTIKPEQLLSLVTELSDALNEREIQAYFTDKRLQSLSHSYGWSGEIEETGTDQDYVMVVNANIGGGKSDSNITQMVDHQSVIEEDGSIIDTVIITRTHEGKDSSDTLQGQMNSSYVRVYVPKGAELLDAGGFTYPDEGSFLVSPSWYSEDTDLISEEQLQETHAGTGTRVVNEFGKTSFGNWVVTYPHEKTQVYFTYRLPFKAFDKKGSEEKGFVAKYAAKFASLASENGHTVSRYSIVMQRQSGVISQYTHTAIYPPGWHPMWKTGDDISLSLNGASSGGNWKTDKIFGIVMKYEP